MTRNVTSGPDLWFDAETARWQELPADPGLSVPEGYHVASREGTVFDGRLIVVNTFEHDLGNVDPVQQWSALSDGTWSSFPDPDGTFLPIRGAHGLFHGTREGDDVDRFAYLDGVAILYKLATRTANDSRPLDT